MFKGNIVALKSSYKILLCGSLSTYDHSTILSQYIHLLPQARVLPYWNKKDIGMKFVKSNGPKYSKMGQVKFEESKIF